MLHCIKVKRPASLGRNCLWTAFSALPEFPIPSTNVSFPLVTRKLLQCPSRSYRPALSGQQQPCSTCWALAGPGSSMQSPPALSSSLLPYLMLSECRIAGQQQAAKQARGKCASDQGMLSVVIDTLQKTRKLNTNFPSCRRGKLGVRRKLLD